jgi:hypothetical protein
MSGAGHGIFLYNINSYPGLTIGGAPVFSAISATFGTEVVHGGKDQIYRFPNGDICAEPFTGNISRWSADIGQTWSDTPPSGEDPKGPFFGGEKSVVTISGTEIISFARTLIPDGLTPQNFRLSGSRKGTLTWGSVAPFVSNNMLIPESSPYFSDNGGAEVGFLKHHGDVWLRDGSLLSQFYGAYREDLGNFADSYPALFKMIKWRTITMRSRDRGLTFGEPKTIAGPFMLARGSGSSPSDPSTLPAYALTQEGFCEADMVRAKNGDLVSVYRTGGRRPGASNNDAPQAGSPVYLNYSPDDGESWSTPVQLNTIPPHICQSSENPCIVALSNGVLVMTWSQGSAPEGNFIAFCDGRRPYVFEGVTQLGVTSNYMSLVKTGYDTVLISATKPVLGYVVQPVTARLVGEGNTAALDLEASPPKVPSGGSACIQNWARRLTNMTISGGAFGALGGAGVAFNPNRGVSTGALTTATTFRVKGEDMDNAGVFITRDITIGIVP